MPKLEGELTLENKQLKAKLAEATAEMRKMKDLARTEGQGMGAALASGFSRLDLKGIMLGAIGGGTALGLFQTIKGLAEGYSKVGDLARLFDTSAESIQRMDIMARQSGTDLDTAANFAIRIARALEDVDNPKVQQAMRELGLSAVDLAGIGPEKQLALIADAFQRAQREGRGFSTVFDLGGKSAGVMIPLLRDFQQEAEKARHAVIVSGKDVEAWKELSDAIGLAWSNLKNFVATQIMHPGHGLTREQAAHYASQAWFGMGGMAPRPQIPQEFPPERPGGIMNMPLREILGGRSLAEIAKEFNEKRAIQEKISTAENAALAKQVESLADAYDRLHKAEDAANESNLSTADKIAKASMEAGRLQLRINDLVGPGVEMEKQRVELAIEYQRVLGKLASLWKEAGEESDRATENLSRLREDTAKGALKLLPPREQLAAMRDRLAASLGLETITSGADVKAGLDRLKQQADDARRRGDTAGETAALTKLQKAQEEADAFARAGGGFKRTAAPGETATAISILTGGSQERMVEETKNNGRKLDELIALLRGDTSGSGGIPDAGGFGLDLD